MFQVFLKDRKEALDFDRMCTKVSYSDPKVCIFLWENHNECKTLAIIPWDNILYIRNYPYRDK